MQGMWGIFEVFADTIVVCSLTALVVLTSGLVDLQTGAMLTTTEKTAMVAEAFGLSFGKFGTWFIAVAVLLFAFSTVLGGVTMAPRPLSTCSESKQPSAIRWYLWRLLSWVQP